MSTTPSVGVSVDPNIKPVRSHENGIPVHRRQRNPVLCQNKGNTYVLVPEDLARAKIAEGLLVEVHPYDPDYMKGINLSRGMCEGFKPGEMIQVLGEPMRIDEFGRMDHDAFTKAAEAKVKEYEDARAKGTLSEDELPKDDGTFAGKKQKRRFGK